MVPRRQMGSKPKGKGAGQVQKKVTDYFGDASQDQKMDSKGSLMMRCLEPSAPVEDVRTVEDLVVWEHLAKEHSRKCMREHRAIQGQMTRMIRSKFQAVAELPVHLQLDALRVDDEPFPLNRNIFTDTPPIPEFSGFTKES